MIAVALTIFAGVWRFIDGRGWGPTWARNVAGLIVAVAQFIPHFCRFSAQTDFSLWQVPILFACALLAWATLILGYTNWPSWSSLLRYGGPTCVIAIVGYVGGASIEHCALYALGGILAGLQYPLLQSTGWRYATATSEVTAGAVIVGGLAWLG